MVTPRQNLTRSGYVLTELAHGSFGTIYKAEKIGLTFAVKEIPIDSDSGLEYPLELDIMRRLSHPNLIHAYNFFFDDETDEWEGGSGRSLFIVMDLASDTLERHVMYTNLSLQNRWELIKELYSGIHWLWDNGIFHCDIKPENILILNDHVKLADFGIAIVAGSTGECPQTRFYRPPEQMRYGDKDTIINFRHQGHGKYLDQSPNPVKSDIWALGLVIYFILTGIRLFYNYNQMNEYLTNPLGYLSRQSLDSNLIPLVLSLCAPWVNDRNVELLDSSVGELVKGIAMINEGEVDMNPVIQDYCVKHDLDPRICYYANSLFDRVKSKITDTTKYTFTCLWIIMKMFRIEDERYDFPTDARLEEQVIVLTDGIILI